MKSPLPQTAPFLSGSVHASPFNGRDQSPAPTPGRPSQASTVRVYGYDDTDLRRGYYHARTLLELTLGLFRTQARRELRPVITPVDDRILRRTANNPVGEAPNPALTQWPTALSPPCAQVLCP